MKISIKFFVYIFYIISIFLVSRRFIYLDSNLDAEYSLIQEYRVAKYKLHEESLAINTLLTYKHMYKGDKYLQKMVKIKNNINESVNHIVDLDVDYFDPLLTIEFYRSQLSKLSDSAYEKIDRIQYKINFMIIVFMSISLFLVLLESLFYRIFLKKVLCILLHIETKKLYLKKYKHSNPIISKLINIQKNLFFFDKSLDVILTGHGIQDNLHNLFNDENFKKYINFDRIGFAKIIESNIIADYAISKSKNIMIVPGYKETIKGSSLKYLKNQTDVRIIPDLKKYLIEHENSESTKLMLKEGYQSSLTAPIIDNNSKAIGFIFFNSFKKNSYNDSDIKKISYLSKLISSVMLKNIFIDDIIFYSALNLVTLVENKDPETHKHLDRMQLYSKIICTNLYNSNKFAGEIDSILVDEIYKYAPMHDIGKVGVPDSILLKPGKLDDEEIKIMKRHSSIGGDVINSFRDKIKNSNKNYFKTAFNIANYHHEKWNGLGYPEGLIGVDIPIEARIVSIADVFDALTTKRSYKRAFSFEESIDIILSESGKSFDPEIIEIFKESLGEIGDVYEKLKEV